MNSDRLYIESGSGCCLKWSAAVKYKEGEGIGGDLYLVQESGEQVLIGIIDGLGHGIGAYNASKKARQRLQNFRNESLIKLIKECHIELKTTRGAVISLALLDREEETLTWIGVGNVEGVILRADSEGRTETEHIILKPGIVGHNLPLLKASIVQLTGEDMLFFSTDGVKNSYVDAVNLQDSERKIVEYIASNYFTRSDDSLILAARYVGG